MAKTRIEPKVALKKEINAELLKELQILRAHPITIKYWALGGASGWLGTNTTPINTCPDGTGRYQHYVNGSIYYHPSIGAHEVHGLIRSRCNLWAGNGVFSAIPLLMRLVVPTELGALTISKVEASIGAHPREHGKFMERFAASTQTWAGSEVF